jgi:hypothetical protein
MPALSPVETVSAGKPSKRRFGDQRRSAFPSPCGSHRVAWMVAQHFGTSPKDRREVLRSSRHPLLAESDLRFGISTGILPINHPSW